MIKTSASIGSVTLVWNVGRRFSHHREKLLLDLVEGGAHFTCTVDIETGEAKLSCDDENVETKVVFRNTAGDAVEQPVAQTKLRGAGDYHIVYVNADDRINLWINNRLIEFDAAEYTRTGIPVPTYDVNDAGDAEPAGIGTVGAEVTLSRLKVLRDIYYTSVKGQSGRATMENESNMSSAMIEELFQAPEKWALPQSISVFEEKKGKTKPMFRAGKK